MTVIYLTGVILAWIPLLALTLVLRRHGKVEWPVITGLSQPAIRCMDKRTPGEGWQLPGGAYALGLPIIYGGLTLIPVLQGWGIIPLVLAGFALYQFFFASPLFVIGLVKVFLHGILSDVPEFPLEVRNQTCKAVVITDPIGLVVFFIGHLLPGEESLNEWLFDTLTAIHWIDVLPFIILGNLVANFGRALRNLVKPGYPWLVLRPGYSAMTKIKYD